MIDVDNFEINSHYQIKFLNKNHLNQVLCLQDLIVKNLPDPTIYYVEPDQFFSNQLNTGKSSIGFFYGDQLVAYNMASFPSIDEENLGIDIGLKKEETLQVVQLGPGAVHPDHRKRGLLSKIAKEHPIIIKKMGYRHVCFTAAPTNYPTIKAFTDNGFLIKQLKLKFNNLFRYIFYLDLKEECFKHPQYSVRIPSTDIESQKFIFSLGFYGYSVLKNDNGFDIVFGHDEIKT